VILINLFRGIPQQTSIAAVFTNIKVLTNMFTSTYTISAFSLVVLFFISLINAHGCYADLDDVIACGAKKKLYSDEFFETLSDKNSECHDTAQVLRAVECVRLGNNEGFIDDNHRALICQLNCFGYVRMCSLFDGKVKNINGFNFNVDLDDLVASSKAYVTKAFLDYDPDIGFVEGDIFHDVEIQTFLMFVGRTWPLLTTLIPLVLNQYAYYNFKGYLFGMAIMMCVYVLGKFTYIESFYNVFIWILCIVSEKGRNPLREFALSYSLIITGTFMCFIVKGWAKFFSGLAVLIIYGFYVYITFIRKTNSFRGTGVAMFIAHLLLMYEQLRRLDDYLHMDAFSFTVVQAIINSVLPTGRSGYLVYNVIDIAYRMVKYIGDDYKIICWVVFIIIQLICFVVIRCLFGVYVINSLRFKADVYSYFTGGLLYSSGIFDGVKYIIAVLFGEEIISSRRMAYSIVNLIMICFEVRCAREFLILRFFIFASDTILWSSVYSNAPKYLDMNIDMKRMAYPQDCASVWVSIKHMTEIAKHVKKLNVSINNKNFKGLGFVNRHSDAGKANVLTIQHVGQCDALSMDGAVYSRPEVKSLSGADDPIVSIELSPYFGEVCKTVQLLTSDEVRNIKQVVISSLTDDGDEPMMVFSNEFEVDRDGDLRVLSSLQEGDSGGPVFAALKDGTIRYAGAVSRTTDDRSKGHKFAFITTANGVRLDSDSENGSPIRNSNKGAIDFNRQRNRSNNRNDSNLANLCNMQSRLMLAAEDFGHWVVDIATEEGYRWVDDDETGGKCEYKDDMIPDDHSDKKRKYDKRRRTKSNIGRVKLTRVKDLADCVFFNRDEYNAFMRMVHAGHAFNYVPGTVLHFINGQLVTDDNPDPSEYAVPD